MQPDELAFVAKSWKLSLQDAPQNSGVRPGVFFNRANRDVDRILARPGTQVLVARDTEDPPIILGFIVVERDPERDAIALHWAYTRNNYGQGTKRTALRRRGVCSQLLEHALQGSKSEELYYTSGSRFDALWENWGFAFVDLGYWLRGGAL